MNSCLQTKNTSIEFAYLVCEFNGGVFFMYHYLGSLQYIMISFLLFSSSLFRFRRYFIFLA
ncbi:hypothetical protein FC693_29610, partial [Bacillus cereus]